jgi:hypothetical protein
MSPDQWLESQPKKKETRAGLSPDQWLEQQKEKPKAALSPDQWLEEQKKNPQPDELGRYKAEPSEETKTSNPFVGLAGRAADVVGNTVEGVARVAENLADKLETAVPLSQSLGLITQKEIDEEQQLKPLFDFSKNLKNWSKDLGYAPSTQLGELPGKPLLLVPFIVERVIASSPDMAAAVAVAPAYIVSLTNEILNTRLENDNKPLEKATAADVAAAAGAAIFQTYVERFATKRLLPGGGGAGATAGKCIGKEAALQSGTEAVEEGVGYLGGAAGTEKGIDPYQMAQQMIEGAIVGGGLGAGVQGGKEYVSRSRANDGTSEPGISGDSTEREAPGGAGRLDKEGLDVLSKRLGALDGREAELNNKLKQAQNYIRDIEATDPNDERLAGAYATANTLGTELQAVKEEKRTIASELQGAGKEKAYNAPGLENQKPEFTKVGDAIVYDKGAFIKGDTKDDLMKASANFTEIVPSNSLYESFYEDFPQFPKGSMDGAVFVHSINVNGKRGTGLGKQILDATLQWADQKGKAIFLVPAAQPDAALGGLNQEQLKEWYARNVFEDHVDYMLRRPQKQKSMNAPGQEGFDFAEPDENTQRSLGTSEEFGLTAPEGKVDVSKPLEQLETPDYETSKMMLVDTGAKPTARVASVIRS